MLIAVTGFNGGGLTTGDLGTVSFTTGALSGGTLAMGGTFASGGTFEVDGNGTGGLPNGVLFSGMFSGSVTWTLTILANGTHNYTLTGVVTGMMGGSNVDGVTVQLTINTGKGFFNGTTTISGGDTTVASAGARAIDTGLVRNRIDRLCRGAASKVVSRAITSGLQNWKRPPLVRAFFFPGTECTTHPPRRKLS